MNILLHSEDDTAVLGAIIARAMQAGDTLLLAGALGAGKTTLAQAIVKTLMPADTEITSPTFGLQHVYAMPSGESLVHMDLYRIEQPSELDALGLDDYLGVHRCLVEWPEKLAHCLPASYGYVHLIMDEQGARGAYLGSNQPQSAFWKDINNGVRSSGKLHVA